MQTAMVAEFEYIFPSIRGIQAGREYYVSMCPLRLIPKIFTFDEEELLPELRAQRTLNRSRIPEMARYLIECKDNYVFSSLTASVDGRVEFEPAGDGDKTNRLGNLHIDMNSQFIINDGQHRRAAIEAALREEPGLGDETISVVFFIDRGLKRCQQMFADLNRYAIRPSKSLGLLYDHRDDSAQISRLIALKSTAFKHLVEMERSTLSSRSRKLFTLSSIHSANNTLMASREFKNVDEASKNSIDFWNNLGRFMAEWKLVADSKITAGEVRQDYVNSHAIVLQSLGAVGNRLLNLSTKEKTAKLKGLEEIDWSRSNASAWEGRAMIGGRMSKSSNNVTLTANYIKQHLGMELTPEEQRVEDAYGRGENG